MAHYVYVHETVPPEHTFETSDTTSLPFALNFENQCEETMHILVISQSALERSPELKAAIIPGLNPNGTAKMPMYPVSPLSIFDHLQGGYTTNPPTDTPRT